MKKFTRRIIVLLVTALVAGCGGETDTEPFSEVRTVRAPEAGTMQPDAMNPHAGGPMPLQPTMGSSLDWTTPPGWVERPASSMRIVNLGIEGEPSVECYVTRLGGNAGGMEANLNRWRSQLSLPPYAADEISALPTKQILGVDAVVAEMQGEYKGMGDAETQPDFALLGAVAQTPDAAYFIKMTGPKTVLERERKNFDAFCASLTEGGNTAMASAPTTNPHAGLPASGGTADAPFEWSAPPSWTQSADRPMRVVTFTVNGAECYVTTLRGLAGGAAANINRWRTQMGQTELSSADLDALDTVTVLGKPSPLVEVSGAYSGMDGKQVSDALLLGVVREDAAQSVFIKMTGPESVVRAERDNFIAFCESIK